MREVENRGSNFEAETGGKLRGIDLGTRVGGQVRSESLSLSVVVAVEFLVSCRPVLGVLYPEVSGPDAVCQDSDDLGGAFREMDLHVGAKFT